jgi:hypothetical protein
MNSVTREQENPTTEFEGLLGILETSQKDVHTEHCCLIHGCKYGYDNIGILFPQFHKCSVTSRLKVQSHPCEDCHYAKQDGYARMERLDDKLVKIPSFLDFTKDLMKLVWAIEHDGSLSPDYQVKAHELRMRYEKDYK